MNRTSVPIVISVLVLAACAVAQTAEIDAPSSTQFKVTFAAEVAALTYANIMDGISTVRNVNQSCEEVGTPFLIGRSPSAARYSAVYGSVEAASIFAAYELKRSHSRALRVLGHGLLAAETTTHLAGYLRNGAGCAR